MKIEDVLTEEWFWAAVAAVVALAAIVGATISSATAAIIKHRERPEPDWSVAATARAGTDMAFDGFEGILLGGTVANAGDGRAFNVRMSGTGCTVTWSDNAGDRVPLLAPGDAASFHCAIPLDGWQSASMELTWTDPPTRLKKTRSLKATPAEITEAPAIVYRDADFEECSREEWLAMRDPHSEPVEG